MTGAASPPRAGGRKEAARRDARRHLPGDFAVQHSEFTDGTSAVCAVHNRALDRSLSQEWRLWPTRGRVVVVYKANGAERLQRVFGYRLADRVV